MGWPLALAVGFSVPGLAQTLPQGGNVVGGAGTITQTAPNQLTINQASQNLAIDWQSFSIGANNIVRFVQPSTSAVALNRVLNGDPSQIYGQIQANGQVVIMSPNGIVFGPNSRVDVNALVATTANISTLDFMAGKLLFDQASSDANARVVNQGIISVAQGGFAVLAAANVSNQGQIIANGGTVVLGGTKTFAIDFHGDGLLKFAATGVVDQKPTGADALVENSGSIEANGGRVLLTARAARSVLDNVINTTGIVVARTASLVNGEIVIDGGDSGIVHVAGTLDASGAATGESGGTVKVLGEKVGLFENARIDASGTAGGGTVLVGGNYQGMGPEANAQYLYMDARAVIDASSASGDGGRVILWSDLATRNAGHINVAGARNGGFIEVSSKGFLDFRGTVNLRGLTGRAGELLLDPTDITISSSSSSGDMSGVSPFVGSNASSNLDVAVLNAALAGGDVTVTTASAGAGTGNIDVTATIANSVAGRTLTLRADGAITVGTGGYISSGGYLFNVSLRAAGNITVGGTGIVTSGGNLTTESAGGGGQAGGNFVSTANINAGTGNVTLAHAGTISIDAAINTTGQLSINAGGATTQTAAITGPASLVIGGTGAVTLANAGNSFSNITLSRTGTSANVSIVNAISGNFQTSTLGSGTFTYSSATAGFLQSGGITQDASGGAVSISGGTGTVTLSQANSFSGPVTVTGDTITVSAAQTATGTGSLSLAATRNVAISANLTTAGGDILITGNVASWAPAYETNTPVFGTASGTFDGVQVNAGVSINAGGGDIAIAGKGGDSGANQHGVRIYAAAATPTTISTTGAGTITLFGHGGLSSGVAGGGLGGSHGGFRFDGDATGVVDVSTANGNIKMVGTGGGTGVSSDNNGGGVFFHTKVRATGSGSIDIAGTPGVGASIGLAAFFALTEISAVSGNIALTGTSGAAYVNDAAFAGSASGLRISGATVKTTGSGSITLRGIDGTEGPGILISNANGTVTLGDAAMTGNLTIQANSLTYTGTNTILHQSGTGGLTFQTETAATDIVFYGSGGGLQLTSALVNALSANFAQLVIGNSTHTGNITTGAAYTAPSGQSLSLTTGGNLTVNYALSTSGTGDISLGAAKAIALLGNVTTGGGDILMMGGNVGPWTSPVTNPTPTFGAATGTFVGVAIGAAIQVTAGAGGDIAIAGRGGDTGGSQYGIQMYSSATVSTSGTGAINMVGRGGGNGDGMAIDGATVSSTGSGAIQMVAIPGTTTGGGFLFSGAVTLGNAAYTGNLTLRSDGAIAGTASVALPHQAGTGNFTVRTHTDATPIFAATAGAGLEFASDLLSAASSYGGIVVGSPTQSGTITMGAHTLANQFTVVGGTAAISIAGAVALSTHTLSLESGGTVTQSAAITGTNGILALGGTGSGAVTLTNGGNSFGMLSLARTGSTGSVAVSTTAALDLASSAIGTGTLAVTSGSGISQSGSLTQSAGGGSVTFDGGSGTVGLSAANTFTGDFAATGSTVVVSAVQTLARIGSQNFDLTGTSGNVLIQANVAKTNTGGAAMSIAAFETAWFDNAGLSSNGGAITIWGNAPGGSNSAGSSAGTAWGVRIDGASAVVSAGAGAISIVGKGSTDAGSGQHGIAMINGGSVQTTTGAIAMQGRGGDGTAIGQLGIVLANSTVQSSSGTVTLTGWGGANSSSDAHGIYVDAGGSVASATGNVTLNGTAPTATAVYLFGGSVSTGGSGTLTLQGSALSGTGIEGGTGSTITAGTGTLTLVSDRDVSIANTLLTTGGALDVTATGSINLSNASNSIGGNTTINATGSTSNVNFRNTAANQNLDVSSTGYLDLYDLSVTGDLTASAVGALTVNTSFAMAAGRQVALTATGVMSTIEISGNVTLSNGNFSAISDRGIAVTANIATNGGDIVMYGHAPGGDVNVGTATGGFHGVRIDGAITVDAGGGNIDIRGRGGNSGSFHGVTIRNGAGVLTSGIGTLDIMGHGGTAPGGGSAGVEFYAGSAYAQTQNGALTVSGYGSTGGGNNNSGVALATGQIRATGAGAVDVSGAGGAGGSFGVSVQGGGTTLISTTDGNLTVIGNGGLGSGGGFESWGVNVAGQSGLGAIQSTGTGNVSVTGTAGATSGNGRYGVMIGTGGSIVATSAAGGTLSVTGTGGPGTGTGNHGIYLTGAGAAIWGTGFSVVLSGTGGTGATSSDGIRFDSGANTHSEDGLLTLTGVGTGGGFGIAATGTGSTIGDPASAGNINLIADTVSMSAATLGIETDGQVLIRPVNAATTIGIGGGAGTLILPSDMSFVDAALLVVGDPVAGAIEVGAGGVNTATGTDLGLRGASIALTGDVTLGAVRTLTLYANTNGVTQAAGSTVTAANLVLRGAGDFAVNRAGSGYNNITNVAADVTAGSGSGAIVLYTGAGGGSSSNALTDGVGTVNGISTPGGLTWVALNGLTQTGAGVISVGGVTNLTAQNGTLDLSAAPNTFSGQVAATSAGGGSILLTASTLALGIVNSAGNVILSATSGGINQAGLLTANGNLNASTNGGPLALSSYQNVVAGSVSLATSGGANNIAWTQSGPMLVGSISSSGQLNLSVTGGGISQVGAISTGGPTILSVDTGNIVLTNAANAFVGSIEASNPSGDISIANTGNTLFGNITSNGVLNVSVTGGTLSQTSGSSISTSGNATVTLAGAYAMTLTESGNNVGGNLALSGSTGTLDGILLGTVTVTTGTFVVNGVTYTGAPTTNTTTPAPGAGAGGTTISSALTDAAPVSQIQAAANLPPPPPPGATAVVSDTVALLTGGPGSLIGGGPGAPTGPAGPGGQAEGGEGGPAVSPVGVVSAPPPPPAAAGPGAPPPAASPGAPPPPAIVVSGGPPPGPGAPPLVPTTAPPPAVTAVGNVGGASAPAVNGGAVQPTTSAPQTAVTSPFPSMSF